MNKKHKIIAVITGVVILVLTFLRENVFVEINAIMDGHSYNNAYFYFFDESISKLSTSELTNLKWVLTIIFILAIFGLTLMIIWLWFKNRNYSKVTLLIYLSAFGIIAIITLFLKAFGYFDDYYFVVRKMIGFIQSPLPLFLFFSMYFYLDSTRAKT